MHNVRSRWLAVSLGLLASLAAAARTAQADVNRTPIAVPIIGSSGVAAPYPSTIDLQPAGGPLMKGQVYVSLHSVTHPCIEDLAVLLVHNGTDKYLLMSHAGGCHPLNGTDIWFEPFTVPMPDEDISITPASLVLETGVANYGPQPAFPSPAPSGPYDPHLPPADLQIQGRWDLYILDTAGAFRGVVAGGWSITFTSSFGVHPFESVPVAIPDNSLAEKYPINFDFRQASPDALVQSTTLSLKMLHATADDLRIMLESPSGRKVMVMANAGGTSDLFTSQELRFSDAAASTIPDAGPIAGGAIVTYKPGSVYGGAESTSLPFPAPPAPYALAFSEFRYEPVRGVWKLWIIDDAPPIGGALIDATLTFNTDPGSTGLSITVPTSSPTFTTTEPFLHLGALAGNIGRPIAAFWRNDANGTFYANGGLDVFPVPFFPYIGMQTDVPLQGGTNVVRLRIMTEGGFIAEQTLTVTVPEFTYTLSEGSTGGFFDEDVTLGNASSTSAPVRIDFLQEGAAPITHTDTVAANAPLQLHVDDLVPGGAVSTVVHSTAAVPLAVERTMSWDSRGYGGSGGTAIWPNTKWLFAEGSQGYFDTFLLLANDNDADADTAVRFLLEGGGVVNRTITVPAHKRVTIYAGDIPELVNRSFGTEITAPATAPITAERAMYFPHNGGRLWEGGHEAAGVNGTSTHWYLAEGATGPFFECFVLLSNPNPSTVHVHLTYLLTGGDTVTQDLEMPANSRSTINVETVDPRLANAAVSTVVTADFGIIVERSMYWPDISIGWTEAHNSPGVVNPALRWGVSDVRVGGARAYQTYILLANPNPFPAEVQVRLLRPGAGAITQNYLLAPTSRTNVVAADLAGNAAGTYSAEVQVLNYQPIVVEKAMYWDAGGVTWAAGTGVVATPFPPH